MARMCAYASSDIYRLYGRLAFCIQISDGGEMIASQGWLSVRVG
jgi:hypothetical protein